jgi:hypothetical protein
MEARPTSPSVPAWDREAELDLSRAQVRRRVATHAADERPVLWLTAGGSVDEQLAAVANQGRRPVVGSDLVLWAWPPSDLRRLSAAVEATEGIVVFVEPTAGLGVRRALQRAGRRWFRRRLGHDFESDVPAALRAAGFIVTTQVRLRHGPVADYVRGEARHFPVSFGSSNDDARH